MPAPQAFNPETFQALEREGWERIAQAYHEHLGSSKAWEGDALKQFFMAVWNPVGHVAGSDEMPKLTPEQTNNRICITSTKNLVQRMQRDTSNSLT